MVAEIGPCYGHHGAQSQTPAVDSDGILREPRLPHFLPV